MPISYFRNCAGFILYFGGTGENEITYPYQIVYLSLTNRCNLRCKHCVASACIEEVDHMNTEDWKR